MAEAKRIVVAPLDWGLGHATRCIPVIQALHHCGQEVIVATSGAALQLLKMEFPILQFIEIEGYKIRYAGKYDLAFSMLRQLPRLVTSVWKEHQQLKKIIEEHKPDAIISDNRFGLWNKSIPSVFITHQLHVQFPQHLKWPGLLVNRINRYFVSRFDECWIPDVAAEPGFSGNLSHPKLKNVNTHYLGLLSRFKKKAAATERVQAYDLTILLSGPEPQRSGLEEILLEQLKKFQKRTLIVRGQPDNDTQPVTRQNITLISHLDASGMRNILQSSGMIISRSGYSSIMDYIAMKKNAILIPTPGQTEQEYLARQYKQQKTFYSVDQKNFDLMEALEACKEYSIDNLIPETRMEINSQIENWLQRISSY